MDFSRNFYSAMVKIRARNTALGSSEALINEFNSSVVRWASVFDVAYALDVTSSNAADAAAGTGARTVKLYGLDGNFDPLTETLTLNGQTIVTSTKTFRRIFEIVVDTAGSGLANAGDLYVVKTGTGGSYTGGVPGTLTSACIKCLAGDNFGLSGMWTCPRGKAYRLSGMILGARNQAGHIRMIQSYPADNNLAYPRMKFEFTSSGTPVQIVFPDSVIAVKEKEDIYYTGIAASAGAIVSIESYLEQVSGPISKYYN